MEEKSLSDLEAQNKALERDVERWNGFGPQRLDDVRLLAVVAGPRDGREGEEEPARRPRRRGDGDRPEQFRCLHCLGRARRPGSSGGRLDDAREAVLADKHRREGRGVQEHVFLRLA